MNRTEATGQDRLAWVVGLLTVMALVLRAVGIDQSLFGDEIFTYDIVTSHSLGDVVSVVRETSITPPLHYLLAWAAVQLGDPQWTVRLPSLVFGTATVPLIFLLGRRTAGPVAGAIAALVLALDPFALFYGTEGRAYATLAFLVTAAAYGLVVALGGGRRAWWGVFAVAAAAGLYTHYTAVFGLAAMGLWALWFHRDRWRAIVAANAAVLLLWAPWIPAYLDQRSNSGIDAINALYDLTAGELLRGMVQVLAGLPFEPLRVVPGTVGLLALGAGLGLAAGWAVADVARGRLAPRPSEPIALIMALAIAAPIGVLLYKATGTSIYAPRNLMASLPGAALLIGALIARMPRPAGPAALTLVVATLVIGTVQFLSPAHRRPPWRQAAALIDARADPGDVVLQYSFFVDLVDPQGRHPLLRSIEIPLRRRLVVVEGTKTNVAARDRAATGRHAWVVVGQIPGLEGPPPPPKLDRRFRLVSVRVFDGFAPVAVYEYAITPRA